MVAEQLMPRFEQQNTRIINCHLEKYQWDDSELDIFAKKLVSLLQERVPDAEAAICSDPEPQAPFVPILSEIIFLMMNVKMGRDTATGNAR